MTWRSRVGAGLAAGLVLLAASPVEAVTIPQYDITLNRPRAVVSRQSVLSFYSPDPVYLHIPGGTTSDSTPTVIGNTAYQYCRISRFLTEAVSRSVPQDRRQNKAPGWARGLGNRAQAGGCAQSSSAAAMATM
jgi:hypothetical protein